MTLNLQVFTIDFVPFAIEFVTFAEFSIAIDFIILNKIGSCSKHENKIIASAWQSC